MKTLKHKKIKNTWLLFDLLTRKIVNEMLSEHNDIDKQKYVDLMEKYFSKKTNLNKELSLYKYLIDSNLTESTIDTKDYIELILSKRTTTIDNKKLAEEKYNLFGEMKQLFEDDSDSVELALQSNISNYKVIASIYSLFEYSSNNEVIYNIEQFFDSNRNVFDYITEQRKKDANNLIEQYKRLNKSSKILTYNLLIEKFNKKYEHLEKNQKLLLQNYVNSVYVATDFEDFMTKEMNNTVKNINTLIETNLEEVHKIKLQEINKLFTGILNKKLIKENYILSLLESYELFKHINEYYRG